MRAIRVAMFRCALMKPYRVGRRDGAVQLVGAQDEGELDLPAELADCIIRSHISDCEIWSIEANLSPKPPNQTGTDLDRV